MEFSPYLSHNNRRLWEYSLCKNFKALYDTNKKILFPPFPAENKSSGYFYEHEKPRDIHLDRDFRKRRRAYPQRGQGTRLPFDSEKRRKGHEGGDFLRACARSLPARTQRNSCRYSRLENRAGTSLCDHRLPALRNFVARPNPLHHGKEQLPPLKHPKPFFQP